MKTDRKKYLCIFQFELMKFDRYKYLYYDQFYLLGFIIIIIKNIKTIVVFRGSNYFPTCFLIFLNISA